MQPIKRRACIAALVGVTTFIVSVSGAAGDDFSSQIDSARNDVVQLMAESRITDADVATSIPLAPLSRALVSLNNTDGLRRTIAIKSTEVDGVLWKDDNTWCGSFAALRRSDGLVASVPLSNFAIRFQEPNLVVLSVDAAVNLHRADVHWHFMGPRTKFPFGGSVCPPSGGFGGDIGATGTTSFTLEVGVKLVQVGGDGGFRYDLLILSPESVSMTLSFEFQRIGRLGVPERLNIPRGVLTSGKIPLLFQTSGTVKLPGGTERSYSVVITPRGFTVNQKEIAGRWLGTVAFKPVN